MGVGAGAPSHGYARTGATYRLRSYLGRAARFLGGALPPSAPSRVTNFFMAPRILRGCLNVDKIYLNVDFICIYVDFFVPLYYKFK